MARGIKYPRPDPAIGAVRAAIAILREHHIILGHAVDHGIGARRAERVEHYDPLAVLFQQALITLHGLHGVILGLAFLPGQHDAIDAAIHIDVIHVIDLGAIIARAHGRIRPDPAAGHREILSLGAGGDPRQGKTGSKYGGNGQGGQPLCDSFYSHLLSPLLLWVILLVVVLQSIIAATGDYNRLRPLSNINPAPPDWPHIGQLYRPGKYRRASSNQFFSDWRSVDPFTFFR